MTSWVEREAARVRAEAALPGLTGLENLEAWLERRGVLVLCPRPASWCLQFPDGSGAISLATPRDLPHEAGHYVTLAGLAALLEAEGHPLAPRVLMKEEATAERFAAAYCPPDE